MRVNTTTHLGTDGKVWDGKNHAAEDHARQANASRWLADNAARFPADAMYVCSCIPR